MFIDRVILDCRSGKGGDGRLSFLSEKNRPLGGADGGNGGRGGSIYLRANKNTTTLVNYRHAKRFCAPDGENGDIKNLYGRKGDDLYIDLPIGSVVFEKDTHKFICDLNEDGKVFLLCKGGRGGRGNACFKNARNKAPKIAENGLPGQRKTVIVELKLLADVGIIGLPSVGKSTFISCVSNCKAEIGDYDFTTIVPNLGVAYLDDNTSFVLADMPGLIKGAYQGKGLGLTFLRHIERTKVLIHLVDMSSDRDPLVDYNTIRDELTNYGMHLIERPEIIVASKVDSDEANEKYLYFKKEMEKLNKEVIPISSLTDFNLKLVLYKASDLLKTAKTFPVYDEKDEEEVYDLRKSEEIFSIKKENENTYRIVGERVLRTYHLINLSEEEGVLRLIKYLNDIGVEEALEKMGAKNGDTVILDDFEFEYFA